MPVPIAELSEPDEFVRRHIGPSEADMTVMLDRLGVSTAQELLAQTMPGSIVDTGALELPGAVPEHEAIGRLRAIAARNQRVTSLIGMGYCGTVTPPVIARNVLENPAWYTAYTPYQPEISQGRLEALLNYQTMIADLTGLEIANASLLDEATAAAEAVTMARRVAKSKAAAVFVDEACHPQNIAVI